VLSLAEGAINSGLVSALFVTCIVHITRSKAQVCGPSPAEIVGSNPTGGMDVCLLSVLGVVR